MSCLISCSFFLVSLYRFSNVKPTTKMNNINFHPFFIYFPFQFQNLVHNYMRLSLAVSNFVVKERCSKSFSNKFFFFCYYIVIFQKPNQINFHLYFQQFKWNFWLPSNQSVNIWKMKINKRDRWIWIAIAHSHHARMLIIFWNMKYLSFVVVGYIHAYIY